MANNGQTALITGASGGIGMELARVFAREGFDLVLVARRKEELDKLASELSTKHGVKTRTVSKDLSKPAACEELFSELEKAGVTVDVLVNNAGFATYGRFVEIDAAKELQQI